MDQKFELPRARHAVPDPCANGTKLEIEHLRKHFGNLLVLDDVNLRAKKGEIVCVIGQSGHGKSVILKHIMGLMVPDGGKIALDGDVYATPLSKPINYQKVRNKLGMLFQGAALFDSKTVGENIAFPLREHFHMGEQEIRGVIAEGLEMVGLQGIEDKMPSELSGGMRSRVGLARAIAMKPEVMLYDEPTSALDPIMADKINDLILDLRKKLGMTSIVVTHDMSSAYKIADHIAMIFQGKIIFDGTPGEIRASRDPYVQQFIRGQRKLHYALEGEQTYEAPVDLERLRRPSYRPGQKRG